MRATIKGIQIEGTAAEMWELLNMAKPEPKTEPVAIEPEEAPKKRKIDWPKAKALKAAGWKGKDIADELGISPATLSQHFARAK